LLVGTRPWCGFVRFSTSFESVFWLPLQAQPDNTCRSFGRWVVAGVSSNMVSKGEAFGGAVSDFLQELRGE
jgi:hypothetical protein